MKYLVKKGDLYLNYYKCEDGVNVTECFFDTLEYAWGFDSIESAQEWANISGGTVVAYSAV